MNQELKTYLQKRYTPRTAICYQSDINIYTSNFKNAETASHKKVMNSLIAIRKRYPNPKTLIKVLSSIKAYYQFLVETGIRTDNPAQSIYLKDKLNTAIQLQDLFSTKELENLLEIHETKAYQSDTLKQRDKVILTLLIYQGLRVGEIERLKIADINLHKGTIYVKASQIVNARELALKPNQIMLFYDYLNQSREPLQANNFLLSHTGKSHNKHEISKLITASYKSHYLPRKLTAQTIRQSVITNLLKTGKDVRVVQVFAGHKSPTSTERYQQTNVEELKTAIQIHHPMK